MFVTTCFGPQTVGYEGKRNSSTYINNEELNLLKWSFRRIISGPSSRKSPQKTVTIFGISYHKSNKLWYANGNFRMFIFPSGYRY